MTGVQQFKEKPLRGTLVLASGCFDPLHIGHIRYLQEAKKLGTKLAVAVTGDEYVSKQKGAGRPHFNEVDRAHAVASLGCVDVVHINNSPDAVDLIEALTPDIYVKGADYEHSQNQDLLREIEAVEEHGGRYDVIHTPLRSASRLLNELRYSEEMLAYFDRTRKFLSDIESAFEKARHKKVLFLGEAITDHYVYVMPLSKPSKEFVLATHEVGEEIFTGGVHAAAAHLENFCTTRVISQETVKGSIIKKRFVDKTFKRKLFETYSMSHLALTPPERERIRERLKSELVWADIVIVTDFGHGLIDARMHPYSLVTADKFIAVNAQSNAGNQGFNSVGKYAADYICVDLPEARLAAQDQHGPIADVIRAVENECWTPRVLVTCGSNGAYWSGGHAPALDAKPVDTMGAGDCFLAYTAPLISVGLSLEAAAFVGNVAASIKTEILGHQRHVDHTTVLQTVRSLLK